MALSVGVWLGEYLHRVSGVAVSAGSIRPLWHLRDHVSGDHEDPAACTIAIFGLDHRLCLDILRHSAISTGEYLIELDDR